MTLSGHFSALTSQGLICLGNGKRYSQNFSSVYLYHVVGQDFRFLVEKDHENILAKSWASLTDMHMLLTCSLQRCLMMSYSSQKATCGDSITDNHCNGLVVR